MKYFLSWLPDCPNDPILQEWLWIRSRQISLVHVIFLKNGHLMKLFTTTEFECKVRGIITEDRFPRQQIVLVNSISIQEVQVAR